MQIKNAEQLFIRLLSEVNNAERQITKALPKLAKATDNQQLSEAFQTHLEETRGQVERLEQVVDSVESLRLKRIKCYPMESLIEESQDLIDNIERGPLLDAALIGAVQKVEHFEIAAYGTLCALAGQLGYTDAKNLLAETLKEEESTDEKLSTLAKNDVNQKAG
ncbi:hypothetical protein GCM10010082_18680 [Kushneria pakistanensis]|uniref:Ferritin-like domain-containing protein n=1 Tax=Kushneria pakistanensis TaxID=1508770 RepID=A0ABQ3FIM9_9GAMM|nr:DUF892 family protein [Kushneria pakistanensis]GHC25909.1 hypothetical protein GCM10010082_18680 [Kushneria pakistanensis]